MSHNIGFVVDIIRKSFDVSVLIPIIIVSIIIIKTIIVIIIIVFIFVDNTVGVWCDKIVSVRNNIIIIVIRTLVCFIILVVVIVIVSIVFREFIDQVSEKNYEEKNI